jgi:hypothetical protein
MTNPSVMHNPSFSRIHLFKKIGVLTIVFLLILLSRPLWLHIFSPYHAPITLDANLIQEIDTTIHHDSLPFDAPSPPRSFWSELSTSTHNAAEQHSTQKDAFNALCMQYESLCNRIQRDSSIDARSAYTQLLMLVGALAYLDSAFSWPPFSSFVEKIIIHVNTQASRGSAWHTSLSLNNSRLRLPREFWEVSVHELWHVLDLWYKVWYSPLKHSSYTEFGRTVFSTTDPSLEFYALSRDSESIRKRWSRSLDFVSGYAMKNPFEDIAESINMYINHYDLFEKMRVSSPILDQKFAIIDKWFGGIWWYPATKSLTSSLSTTARYRDTTSLFKEFIQ